MKLAISHTDPFTKPDIPSTDLVISASQVQTFEDCPRKWWFSYIQRMPQVQKDYFAFGTALHGVCERYLLATDNGYDEDTGEPVELYPDGWATIEQTDKITGNVQSVTLSIQEQGLIKSLIAKAIDEGILVRSPGRKIENQFWIPLKQLEGRLEGTTIWVTGLIDVLLPDSIVDHKTTKNMKYAKSAKKLATNRQMLMYAKVLLEWARLRGQPVPDPVPLTHNVYCKNPDDPRVRKTTGHATHEAIEEGWREVGRIGESMALIRDTYQPLHIWHEVPGPEERASACNKYGGCPFSLICGGTENPENYQKRVLRVLKKAVNSEAQNQTQNQTGGATNMGMDIFKKRLADAKAKKAALAGAATEGEPTINPGGNGSATAVAEPPAQEQPAKPQAETNAPPWAVESCKACGGKGINTRGDACRICDSMQKKAGEPTSAMYVFEVQDDGSVIWEPKAEHADKLGKTTTPPTTEEPKATETEAATEEPAPEEPAPEKPTPEKPKTSLADKLGKKAEEPKAESDDEEVVPDEVMEQVVRPKKGRGRPPKGFTLCVGCYPTNTTSEIIRLDELLYRLGPEIAKEFDADNFYVVNAFKRRDALGVVAEKIASQFGTAYVIGHNGNPDMAFLVDALRPLAMDVIEGVQK